MTFDPGDYVRIGNSALTWEIAAIYPEEQSANGRVARLISGQTERERYEPVANLSLFKRGDAA